MPFCSACGKQAEDSWNYCPMDATPLPKANTNNTNTFPNGMAKVNNPYVSNNNNIENPYLNNNGNNVPNPYVSHNNVAVNIPQFIVRPCGRCEAKGRLSYGTLCPVCIVSAFAKINLCLNTGNKRVLTCAN